MISNYFVRDETVSQITRYIESLNDVDERNISIGSRTYSPRDLLEEVERRTVLGINFARFWDVFELIDRENLRD